LGHRDYGFVLDQKQIFCRRYAQDVPPPMLYDWFRNSLNFRRIASFVKIEKGD